MYYQLFLQGINIKFHGTGQIRSCEHLPLPDYLRLILESMPLTMILVNIILNHGDIR